MDNINETSRGHAFASALQPAWHGLGKVMPRKMTTSEAIEEALLDYEVQMTKVRAMVEGNALVLPDRFITYRTDTLDLFDTVSNRYHILQNKEAFNFIDELIGEGELAIETAGALGKGEKIFVSLSFPDHISVQGVDDIKQYLLLFNDHTGKSSVTIKFTNVRVVCNNTLEQAMSMSGDVFQVRHSSKMRENLTTIKKILNVKNSLKLELSEIFGAMSETTLEREQASNLLARSILSAQDIKSLEENEIGDLSVACNRNIISTRKYNILKEIKRSTINGKGQDFITCRTDNKLTLFGLYNGITHYYSHKANKDREKLFTSMFSGSIGNQVKSSSKILKNYMFKREEQDLMITI